MKKSKEELYKWFWNKFDSCYLVEHKDNIGNYYMFYDEQFVRQKKMARILDEEIVYPLKPSGKVLFYQDWENENFRCNYDEIWTYLVVNYCSEYDEANYSDDYDDVSELIVWMLEEHEKLSILRPKPIDLIYLNLLKEKEKLSILTEKRIKF